MSLCLIMELKLTVKLIKNKLKWVRDILCRLKGKSINVGIYYLKKEKKLIACNII